MYTTVSNFGHDPEIATAHRIPTFESRSKMIMASTLEWDVPDELKEETRTAIKKLANLATTRNHWVHGNYCRNADGSSTVIFDYRQAANSPKRKRPVKAHDIEDHAEAVNRRGRAIEILSQKIEKQPSLDKSR